MSQNLRVINFLIHYIRLWYSIYILVQVCGLRSKSRTLTGKKEQNKLKKWRKTILVIAKTTGRIAEWLFSPLKVPV